MVMNKRLLAALLALAVAFSGILMPMDAYAVQKVSGNVQGQENAGLKNDLSVKGTNSFGNLLAGELSQEAAQQQENLGCNIFSIEVTDKQADVSFETTRDCTLVVAIYEDDGIKMLDSAKIGVSAGETQAAVYFGQEEMPRYFYVRGYLVDDDNLQPLCISYDSPMYTQEMQEFLAKTTGDFDADRVLNLDGDTENNFAVYNEETVRIPESENKNHVVTADDGDNTYVIEDADEHISSLKKDDIFAYEYGNDEILIAKVASIRMDGTTATITGADTSMEEVFEYVKIDGEAGTDDAWVDDSSCGEGVTYVGLVDDPEEGGIEGRVQRLGGSKEKSLKHEFNKKFSIGGGSVTISGGVELKLNFTAQLYISRSEKYVELKMDYTAQIRASADGKIKKEIPLATVSFLFYGIEAELTPNMIVDASANISLKGTLKGTVGFQATLNGMRNVTSTPKFTTEFKAEGKIYVGLSLVPRVSILNKDLASASLDAKVGAEVDAALSQDKGTTTSIHACRNCIKGEIYAKFSLTAEASILMIKSPTLQLLDVAHKIADFYYSLDCNEFAFTTCPHYRYRATVVVLDESGKKIANAKVKSPFEVSKAQAGGTVTDVGNLVSADHITTGQDGRASGYLSPGKYTLEVSADGYEMATKKIALPGNDKEILVRLKKKPEVVVPPVNPGGSGKVKSVSLGAFHVGAIMEDGSLYIWGYHKGDKEEKYVTPVKVLEHVSALDICGESMDKDGTFWESIAAIQEDGSLYMCGWNADRPSGSGNEESNWILKKMLNHVESIKLEESCSAAITKDKELYLWGGNEYGQLGNGTTDNSSVPIKVLDHVISVEPGYTSTAITEDGSLYRWGGNYGKGTVPVKVLDHVASLRGNYVLTKDDSLYWCGNEEGSVPTKKLDHVASFVSDGYYYEDSTAGAITKDGSLYMWGNNWNGQLGNGTTENSSVPIKVLENVASVDVNYGRVCRAITKDGSLYMWGDNSHGALGNGTTENSSVPIKVLENVVSVDVGGDFASISGAITKDGSLYIWGARGFESSVLRKVLDNVVSVDSDSNSAVTKDGNLYIWSRQEDGDIVPLKVLDYVTTINSGPEGWHYLQSTITKDGSLYMWGHNRYGQLGNGTTEDSLTPVKVNFPGVSAVAHAQDERGEESSISAYGLPKAASSKTTFSEERTDSSQSGEPAYTNAACTYFDLPPNETCNFYVVKKRDAGDVLDADNLLYIWQASTDESGILHILYNNNDVESLNAAEHFIVGLQKRDISAATMTVPNLKYDGTEQFVTPQVTYQGETLVEGVDYELASGYSATGSGNHTVTVSGIGIYTGTLSADYQVVCNHSYKDSRTLVKAAIGRNGTMEQKCSVCGVVSVASIPAVKTAKLSVTECIYNGKIRKPAVTVADSKGNLLKNNTDYTVSYASDGKNVGIHTVMITLKGKYSGTIKKTFTVKPKGTSIAKLTPKKKGFIAKWKKQGRQITGYEIQYSTSSKFKGTKTIKNIKAKVTSRKVTKLKAKKKYYVRIRTYKTVKVNGKTQKLYSGWSKAKKVTTKK